MTRLILAAAVAAGGWLAADDPVPRPKPVPLRKDDLGKAPAGWTAAHTGAGGGGAWRVITEPSSPGGDNLALLQAGTSPGPVYNLCLADAPKLRDLELGVAFESIAGDKDQGGGVLWRCRDENNYYVARYNPLEDNFRLYKVVAGRRTQLATAEGLKSVAGWRTIQIKHAGAAIECHLDGKKRLTAEDDTLPDAGRIGLWTKSDAQTRFATLAYRNLARE